MKIGDLVRCKHVYGKPLGVVVSEPRHGINVSTVDVLVTTTKGFHGGQVLPFRLNSLEKIR